MVIVIRLPVLGDVGLGELALGFFVHLRDTEWATAEHAEFAESFETVPDSVISSGCAVNPANKAARRAGRPGSYCQHRRRRGRRCRTPSRDRPTFGQSAGRA